MPDAVVSELHVYPIKSCRGTRVEQATVTERGLAGDRCYQVVDADGLPITQRQHASLATVQPTIVADGLRLGADGAPSIALTRPTANDVTVTSLAGVSVEAADAGDEAADWFTDLLGVPARLVALTDDSDAHLPLGDITSPLSWADAAPVLVANQASLDWLVERSSAPFGIDRFRPNVVVDAGRPWVEDTWAEFSVGGATSLLPFPWPRCAIPQIDQISGERHAEPARVLKAHRWCTSVDLDNDILKGFLEGNALFGVGCALGPAGTVLRVGDAVTALATTEPLLAPPA